MERRRLMHAAGGLAPLLVAVLAACAGPENRSVDVGADTTATDSASAGTTPAPAPPLAIHRVERVVQVGHYFEYIDSVVASLREAVPYELTEHLLLGANPWLVDSLAATDYEIQKARGVEALRPRDLTALHAGAELVVPSVAQAAALTAQADSTWIDVNIPEFTLRVMRGTRELHAFPVRVGQDRSRHLDMAGREVDLRTQTGEGEIVRIENDPRFVNPVDNHEYEVTRRDDGVVTGLPRIPFLEPELDGLRHGQLIHPTTNPATLGGPVSNGCIGTSEFAAWIIYAHAPIGTRVVVRYDLDVLVDGEPTRLDDIYGWGTSESDPARNEPPPSGLSGGCVDGL